MKCLLFLAMLNVTVAGGATETEALGWSIRQAENTSQTIIGAAGERSTYQFMRYVWSLHSRFPFYLASSTSAIAQAECDRVFAAHVEWIRQRLSSLGYSDSPYNIALVYKAGYRRCAEHRVRRQDYEYALRVENLYESSRVYEASEKSR